MAATVPPESAFDLVDPPPPPPRRKSKAIKLKPPLTRPAFFMPPSASVDLVLDSDDAADGDVIDPAHGNAMAIGKPTIKEAREARVSSKGAKPSPHLQPGGSPVILPLAERLKLQRATKQSDQVAAAQPRPRAHVSPAIDLSNADGDGGDVTSPRHRPVHPRSRCRASKASLAATGDAVDGLVSSVDRLQLATGCEGGEGPSPTRRPNGSILHNDRGGAAGGVSNAAKAVVRLMAGLALDASSSGSSSGSSGGSGKAKSSPSGSRSSQGWSFSEAGIKSGNPPSHSNGSSGFQLLSTPGIGSGFLIPLPSAASSPVEVSPSSGSPYPHEAARKRGRSSRRAPSQEQQRDSPSPRCVAVVATAATVMNENRAPSFGPSVGAGDVLQRHRDTSVRYEVVAVEPEGN
jgi:hypothetical protein